MHRQSSFLLIALLVNGMFVHHAQAHFLFIQIGPHAEAGRGAEVFFSERATAGDPKFVARIAHTELWCRENPGQFNPLSVQRAPDRLRAFLPSRDAVEVIGRCEYGVLKRDKSFLLRYYPKAVSGKPDSIAKFERFEQVPLEIMPSFTQDWVKFLVLRDGKPLAGTIVTTIDANLQNEELTTGLDGVAMWKLSAPGQFAAYVRHVVPQAGEKNGESYSEIREFATIAFDWPLEHLRGDDAAVAQFERAIAARAAWNDFAGLTASVSAFVDDRQSQGRISVAADGEVTFLSEPAFEDEAARTWVRDQIHSIVIHRLPPSVPRAKPVLSFADGQVDHPLGRLLTFHGGHFASTYRVRDDEITVVNRHLGKEIMSLQMLDSERNSEGKILPRSYQVQYRDAQTGVVTRVEAFRSRWQRVGQIDLPESILQTISTSSGVSTRSLTLKDVQLKGASK